VTQFNVARRCQWRYEWIDALDPEVYAVILEELQAEDEATAAARGV
jgi:hypothetical protein